MSYPARAEGLVNSTFWSVQLVFVCQGLTLPFYVYLRLRDGKGRNKKNQFSPNFDFNNFLLTYYIKKSSIFKLRKWAIPILEFHTQSPFDDWQLGLLIWNCFKPSRIQWSVKTIYLSSDGFSLNNNYAFTFLFPLNNSLCHISFHWKYNFYQLSISKIHFTLDICYIVLYSSKIQISFFFLWLIKFLWLVSNPIRLQGRWHSASSK